MMYEKAMSKEAMLRLDKARWWALGRELDHSAIMSKFSDRHNELVTEFLADYEAEATAAPVRLNGQGNDQ